jgi:hypothetical protein
LKDFLVPAGSEMQTVKLKIIPSDKTLQINKYQIILVGDLSHKVSIRFNRFIIVTMVARMFVVNVANAHDN